MYWQRHGITGPTGAQQEPSTYACQVNINYGIEYKKRIQGQLLELKEEKGMEASVYKVLSFDTLFSTKDLVATSYFLIKEAISLYSSSVYIGLYKTRS